MRAFVPLRQRIAYMKYNPLMPSALRLGCNYSRRQEFTLSGDTLVLTLTRDRENHARTIRGPGGLRRDGRRPRLEPSRRCGAPWAAERRGALRRLRPGRRPPWARADGTRRRAAHAWKQAALVSCHEDKRALRSKSRTEGSTHCCLIGVACTALRLGTCAGQVIQRGLPCRLRVEIDWRIQLAGALGLRALAAITSKGGASGVMCRRRQSHINRAAASPSRVRRTQRTC